VPNAPGLSLLPYADCDATEFRDTLLATYEGSLDCPEFNDARTPDQVMAGYYADTPEPRRWWLAVHADRPAGVLLLADGADPESCEVALVGVVPALRGGGIGRALMCHAIGEAKAANRRKLGVFVDSRNTPAVRLYTSLGFKPCGCREVFLSLWPG
jgi:ribosomal protein S18 acetylase RimI-like enzyme